MSGGVPWAFTFAALSFDVLALGSLRLRVFRHVGVGFPPPPRLSTAWRWGWVASASASFDTLALGPSASASFDTLALGCPRLRVFRHLGIGPPPPPRLSTPWRWVASASASFDTLALGPLRLRVFRRLGGGSLRLRRWVVACHLVWFAVGLPRRPAVHVVIGSLGRRGWTRSVVLWSAWLSWGTFRRFRQWEGWWIWRGCVEEGGGSLLVSGGVEKIRTARTRHDFCLSRSRDAPGEPPLPYPPVEPSSDKERNPHPSNKGGEGYTQRGWCLGTS